MSADGLIEDMGKPVEVIINCYWCSRPINLNNPSRGHENCLKEEHHPKWQGRLRVTIEIVNVDEDFLY